MVFRINLGSINGTPKNQMMGVPCLKSLPHLHNYGQLRDNILTDAIIICAWLHKMQLSTSWILPDVLLNIWEGGCNQIITPCTLYLHKLLHQHNSTFLWVQVIITVSQGYFKGNITDWDSVVGWESASGLLDLCINPCLYFTKCTCVRHTLQTWSYMYMYT